MNDNPGRRDFLLNSAKAAAVLGAIQFPFIKTAKSQTLSQKGKPLIIGHGDFRYAVDKAWGNLDPSLAPVLNCHEMCFTSKKHIYLINDDTRNNIIVYDQSGRMVDRWGSEFPGGHGITLANENGEEYLYICDCGWRQQSDGEWIKNSGFVVKMTLDGKLLYTIGHPQTYGLYEAGMEFNPTEVAMAPDGGFYVADGYGSQYIIKYNHQGEYQFHFGGANNEDKNYNLKTAHGVIVDKRKPNADPTLVVSSRSTNEFKRFTLDGDYIATIAMPGAAVCRPIIHGKELYASVIMSQGERRSGFVTILDDQDRVISNPGGRAPEYKDGELQTMAQANDGVFIHPHDVCIDNEDSVYVCQWNADKTYPIKLTRV